MSADAEVLAESCSQRPPATVVRTFVQIAIQNISRKRCEQLCVVHDRGDHGLLQIADRLFKGCLCATSGIADFPEQHTREMDGCIGAQCEPDISIPHGAIEFALN